MGNGQWAMGNGNKAKSRSQPHAPCPMPHAHCPMPNSQLPTHFIRYIKLNAVLKAYSTAFDLLGKASCQIR